VFSYLRTLTTWHCPHSPAARRCCNNRSISPVSRAHSSKPSAAGWPVLGQTDGQTDGQTPYRCVSAPNTMQSVPTRQWHIAGSAPDTPSTMDSSSLGARRLTGHDTTNTMQQSAANYRHGPSGLKASPYSIAERRVPELIPVLGSQPAGDVSHKPGGRLPLLFSRPAVTPATLKRAATNFVAW